MILFRRPSVRRRLSGRLLLCLPAAVLIPAAAGCSGADTAASVSVPGPPPGEAKLCQALHKALPKTLAGLGREDPRPRSELTAGWGNGEIVLRCGVPRPAEMDDPQADAVDANGVSWMVEERDSGPRFTTTYRKTYVEVTMDARFANDATPLATLAPAVAKTVPPTL